MRFNASLTNSLINFTNAVACALQKYCSWQTIHMKVAPFGSVPFQGTWSDALAICASGSQIGLHVHVSMSLGFVNGAQTKCVRGDNGCSSVAQELDLHSKAIAQTTFLSLSRCGRMVRRTCNLATYYFFMQRVSIGATCIQGGVSLYTNHVQITARRSDMQRGSLIIVSGGNRIRPMSKQPLDCLHQSAGNGAAHQERHVQQRLNMRRRMSTNGVN